MRYLIAIASASVFTFLISSTAHSDPLYSEQWALKNTGQVVREEITDLKSRFRPGVIGADLGWEKISKQIDKKLKRDVVVAVLDSGIDLEHEELATNIFKNSIECDNGRIPLMEAKEDRDGNGYKGDCLGINLTSKREIDRNRPFDEWGHGTHVASLMIAQIENGIGIKGLSSRIKILPVKVVSENDSRVRIPLSERVAEGILYAVKMRVDVINLSVGWPRGMNTKNIEDAIKEASRNGIIIVAAAGNNAHAISTFPCSYPEVICVGASRNDGSPASFSNYGAHVDILAPGDYILGAFPENLIPNFYHVKGFEIKSGTSQAAPYVSGAAALIKGLFPQASSAWVTAKLLSSAQKPSTPNSGAYFNGGNLRLDKLLDEAEPEYLRWIFKQDSVLKVSADNKATLPIQIQNLSSQSKTISVSIQSNTVGLKFLNSIQTLTILPWQSSTLYFSVEALPAKSDSQLHFTLSFNDKKMRGEILLARELINTKGISSLSVQDSAQIKSLSTVISIDNEVKALFYFSFDKALDNNGLIFNLWKRTPAELIKISSRKLQDIVTPIGVFEMDANADGIRDIVIPTLRKVKNDSNGNEEFRMSIYYFDEKLNPLLPKQERIDLNEENIFNYASFGNHRITQWFNSSLKGYGVLKVPSTIEVGASPKLDLNPRDRRTNNNPSKPHVYYLEPVQAEPQFWKFQTRILDGEKLDTEIRKTLDLRYYENLSPQFAFRDQGESSTASYVFRAGQLEASHLIEVNISSAGATWRKLFWPSVYIGYTPMLASNELHVEKKHDVLFGMISSNRAHLVILSDKEKNLDGQQVEQSITLDLPIESEDIVQALYFSIKGEQVIAVLEAGQSLYGYVIENGIVKKIHQKRVARSTFHGNAISQVFLPIQLRNGQAALYVDSTKIYANNVFVMKLDPAKGFASPLAASFTLPLGCTAMTPTQWAQNEAHKIAMLCKNLNTYEIKYIEVP